MPYTNVNSTLQMYTSSRAEGEAIVLIATDPRTTNTPHGKRERTTRGRSQLAQTERSGEEGERGDRGSPNGAQRSPQSECPRPSEGAKGATTRGETERSDRTPPRDERKRDEPPNDKDPAWMQGCRGGRREQPARAEGERGNEPTDRTERRRSADEPTARSEGEAGERAEGRRRAPPNEEGRKAREPRDPEGVAAGGRAAPSCPRRGDKLTFVNSVLSTCKTTA